jgi:heterotetrameric sarcosine oxidase gamma subunit
VSATPVRRGPLEHVHAALGARWIDEAIRWPASYAVPEREQDAVRNAGGVAEIGPLDKLLVTSASAASGLAAAGLTLESGRVAANGEAEVWGLAPGEAIVVTPPGGTDALATQVRAARAAATDVSSGWTMLALAGPRIPDPLQEACAVDLSDRALREGQAVQASMAGVRVIVARIDIGGRVPAFRVLVARDEAEHLWGALLHLGRPHGLTPVGQRAMAGAPVSGDARP